MATRPRSAPFSTHARGVPLFDRARFLDVPRHATSAILDLRDIGSSAFWFISMQSWFTLWSVFINIVAVVFFSFYQEVDKLAVELDFTVISFTVILPLLGFLWISYQRRERCLALLSECKCIFLSTLTAHQQWMTGAHNGDTHLQQAQIATASIVTAMRSYFLPVRFYSRNYPYLGYKGAMIQIALDRARSQRQIRDGVTNLTVAAVMARSSGLSGHLETLLHERALRLSVIIDQLSNVKEFGTPQGIRSVARFYFCLVIPLFFAPYWAWVEVASNFALAFFLSISVQIALVGLMNVAIALEDPFDNSGMDGIFIDEQLYDVEQALIASGADLSSLENGAGQNGNGAGNGNAVVNGDAAGGPAGGTDGRPRVSSAGAGQSDRRTVRVATDAV